MADPMQWWGALTQQFQQIATSAMREAARTLPTEGAVPAGAADPVADSGAKATKKPPAGKKSAAKKAPARKSAAKSAKKPAARPAGKTSSARKAAPKQAVAEKATPRSPLAGWPLPPPFKTGR